MKIRKLTIGIKLILVTVLVATVSIAGVSYFQFDAAEKALQKARLAGLETVADLKVKVIEEFADDLIQDMQIAQDYFNIKTNLPIASQFTNDRTNPAYIAAERMLDDQLETFRKTREFFDIMLLNPEGQVVYANNREYHQQYMEDTLQDPGGRAFEEGVNEIFISNIYMFGDNFEMLVTGPVHDFDGKYIGVIAFEIDMGPVFELIQDTTGLGETGETLIGRKEGDNVLFLNPLRHDGDAAFKRTVAIGGPEAIPVQEAVQGKSGAGLTVDYRGEEILAAWRHVPSVDWGLVAKIDTSEAYAAIAGLQRNAVVAGGSAFALAFILGLAVSTTITTPIRKLADVARRISQGELKLRAETSSGDELALLATSFNEMADTLVSSQGALAKRNRELEFEITERKRAEEETSLLLETTQAISESQNFTAALKTMIRKICQTTDWDFGEAWIPSLDEKVLKLSPARYSTNNSLRKFGQLSEEFTFPPNSGLPGRVWSSKQPEWIPDVSSLPVAAFPRARVALEAGLKAGFGVPIITGGQVLAVLGFFRLKAQEEDSRLVKLISSVAIQLGLVLQRKQAEEEIARLASFPELNPDLVIETDLDGVVTYLNSAARKEFSKLLTPGAKHQILINSKSALAALKSKKGKALAIEVEIGNGIYEQSVSYIPESKRLRSYIKDITERKQAEEALRYIAEGVSATTGETFFHSLTQHLTRALAVEYAFIGELEREKKEKIKTIAVSAHGEIVENFEYLLANTPCENVVGKSQCAYPHGVREQFPKDSLLAEMGAECYYGIPLFNSTGGTLGLLVIMDSKPTSNQSIVESMLRIFAVRASAELERKQAEEKDKQMQAELALSSRLAAIGQLAAGVAHEINNPLTGIIGFSQFLMGKSDDEETKRDLEIIHNEGLRAAKIVKNLLTFARRHEPKREYVDINDTLQKTLELAYTLKTSNIKVVTDLAPSLPKVMVDYYQIQQVFLNIILNAEQAMLKANHKGKLNIKTQAIKDYIRVSLADDGPGISAEHLDKLFDPFFTTRGEEGGTGLGLSICHGIITEHGGRLHAKSKPGEGATFFIELPLKTKKITKSKAAAEESID